MKKVVKCLIKPKLIIIYLMNKGYFNWLNDKTFLKIKFKLIMNRKLNLVKPQTFNEKLQWLKLYDRNPEYARMVDKYEAKEYVTNIIGDEYIIPTLGIYDKFEDINFEKLPKQFVLKPTHTSGNVFICKDKSEINYRKLRKTIKKWLRRRYYYYHREWPYKNIKPRIIAEEYMVDESKTELKDYKFFCFNGEPKFLFVAKDRPYNTKFNFYDLEFNKIPVKQHYENFEETITKPRGFYKMLELSKKLSCNIPHVRVDFYDINGKVYFGELTFFHFSGFQKFEPNEYDKIIGDMIKLPKRSVND